MGMYLMNTKLATTILNEVFCYNNIQWGIALHKAKTHVANFFFPNQTNSRIIRNEIKQLM